MARGLIPDGLARPRTPRRRPARKVATLKENCLPRWLTATVLFSDGEIGGGGAAHSPPSWSSMAITSRAMRLLARIGIERDVLDDAQLLLEAVLDPGALIITRPRFEICPGCLFKRHMYQRAQEQADRLLAARAFRSPNYRTLHAMTYVGSRLARTRHRTLPGTIERLPRKPADLRLSIAHSLKDAWAVARRPSPNTRARGGRRGPVYGDAYWSLANLKGPYRFEDRELQQMHAAGSGRVGRPWLIGNHLCFCTR